MNKLSAILTAVIFAVILPQPLCAQGRSDRTVEKIIELGQNDNRTMDHEDYLANHIGGRLIGSHALSDAQAWVKSRFESWGLEVMVQEVGQINVAFNRGPWFGRMLSEDGMILHFGTPAYTAGTKGPQKGHVVIEPKSRREFERMKGRLKGAWVLLGSKSTGMAIDRSDAANEKRAEIIAKNEEIERQNGEIRRYNYEHRDAPKELVPYEEGVALFYKEMVEAGVLGFIQSAEVPLRILYDRPNCFNITMDNLPTVCDIKLDEHQFDKIYQKARERQDFLLEFDIRNHFTEGPVKFHNIIGIMKGSKYPDQYVLMGGHLDAYDIGTGAVDDGNGTAVTMEAARLLCAAGAKPKRSILFCIWTGEEYGLLGSKYFVENKSVKLENISNYFNRDGGPTVATGITVPQAMYDDFVEVCKGVEKIHPDFPFKVNVRRGEPQPRPTRAGGSDHAYFAMNGVPTISFDLTDPKGYDFNYGEIWHTERDMYNKLIPEYLEHSSVVNAVVIYGLANLNHTLSREGLYSSEAK